RDVLKVKGIEKAYGDNQVLHGVDLYVRRGDRLAVMGPNGIGKSTLLKIIMGEVEADAGSVEWGYETHPGYFAQDHHEQLDSATRTAEEWVGDFCPDKGIGFVRGEMALMLFSGDDGKKRLSALSGGEAARLVFTSLAIEKPNVLVLDEPTNHLDLESIEALVEGLQKFTGTLILVSHDRWFISRLATRIVDIEADGITDYQGSYDEYVAFAGADRLDAEEVALRAKASRKKEEAAARVKGNGASRPGGPSPEKRRRELQERHTELTGRIAAAEARIADIETVFADPGYYDRASPEEMRVLETERAELEREVEELMAEWERAGEEMEALR
ncbi:MAG TPA: ATP-binding cassette domain-containing protein, partial [Longimicrobiales bacterium]|nr:ATP-binding cassette domain-containing protein [Longimicrobiales bacterium]